MRLKNSSEHTGLSVGAYITGFALIAAGYYGAALLCLIFGEQLKEDKAMRLLLEAQEDRDE